MFFLHVNMYVVDHHQQYKLSDPSGKLEVINLQTMSEVKINVSHVDWYIFRFASPINNLA